MDDRRRVDELEKQLEVLRKEKAALEDSAASASELITAMNDEIDALRAANGTSSVERELAAAQATVAQQAQQLSDLKAQLEEQQRLAEAQHKEHEAELETLKRSSEESTRECDRLRGLLQEAQQQQQQQQKQQQQQQVPRVTLAPGSAEKAVGTLQSQVVVLKHSLADKKAELASMEAMVAGLTAELQEKEQQCQRVAVLEKQLAEAQEARQTRVELLSKRELEERLRAEQARCASLQDEVALLHQQFRETNDMLQYHSRPADSKGAAADVADTTQKQIAKLSVERADAESRFMRCARELRAAQRELCTWKADTLAQYVAQLARFEHVPPAPKAPEASAATSGGGSKGAVGFLAALFRSPTASPAPQVPDGFVAQMQRVLEESLLKNAQLQHDVIAIAEECDALTAKLQQQQQQQQQDDHQQQQKQSTS